MYKRQHPLFVTNVDDTRLDDIAAWTYRAPVEDQARLGFAIAHALDNSAPAVDGIEPELQSKIDVIVQALAGADVYKRQPRTICNGEQYDRLNRARTRLADPRSS